jgi:hypothetical protein
MLRGAAIALSILWLQDSPDRAKFEESLARILRDVAVDYVKLGEYLDNARLHRWAVGQFEQALEFDPDSAKARKRLGYSKQGDAWQRDPEIDVKTKNTRTSGIESYEKEMEQRKAKAHASAAKDLEKLAGWCRQKGLADEAKICLRRLLEFDRSNAKALQELGYTIEGERWISPEETELRRWFRDSLDTRPRGVPVEGESDVEKKLKIVTEKRRSDRFAVESGHLKGPQLERLVQHLEQVWEIYHGLFGLEQSVLKPPISVIILRSQQEHSAFIDAFEKGSDADKALSKKNDGAMYTEPPMAECVQREKGIDFVFDYCIHASIHLMLAYHLGTDRPWLTEGLATAFTRQLRGTALCACVRLEGTSREGGKTFTDPANWPLIVREWVRKGGDPELSLVLRSSLNELDQTRLVKSWSLLDFLMTAHRERLKDLLAALEKDPKDSGEAAFRQVFGWSVERLESEWRGYTRRAY